MKLILRMILNVLYIFKEQIVLKSVRAYQTIMECSPGGLRRTLQRRSKNLFYSKISIFVLL